MRQCLKCAGDGMLPVLWLFNAIGQVSVSRHNSSVWMQRICSPCLSRPDCLSGKHYRPREVPDHPLVNQTIHDCLTEAMDIDELEQLIAAIERKELTLVAKDLREPSPFAQEIINARPYAFLDDAPFEERRTNAIRNRRWADPAEAKDFSLLDEQAIQRVREEAGHPWATLKSCMMRC